MAALAAAATLGSACSADSDDDGDGFQSTQGSGATNSGGSGSGDPSGAGGDIFSGSTGGTGSGVGGGCAGLSSKAEKVPLDIFIMLDRSGSMDDPVSGGGSKWTATTSAITAFVNSPDAAGIGVGIQYFGLPPSGGQMCPVTCVSDADCGACGPCIPFVGQCFGSASAGDSCVPADYAVAAVEIAPLPGVAPAIVSSMAAHAPSTGTPTKPALEGAIMHAQQWATTNPSHVVVVLFATDGQPQACDLSLANINAVAAAGFNGMPSIPTFVIGVGSELASLNGIAASGGTDQAYLVDTNANAQAEFLAAMQDIQGKALPCAYTIPEPTMGEMLDYDEVNVEYTPGGGGTAEYIPKVDNEAACPASGDGWYYDAAAPPSQILLCPGTCEKLSLDVEGSVNIVLGCETIVD